MVKNILKNLLLLLVFLMVLKQTTLAKNKVTVRNNIVLLPTAEIVLPTILPDTPMPSPTVNVPTPTTGIPVPSTTPVVTGIPYPTITAMPTTIPTVLPTIAPTIPLTTPTIISHVIPVSPSPIPVKTTQQNKTTESKDYSHIPASIAHPYDITPTPSPSSVIGAILQNNETNFPSNSFNKAVHDAYSNIMQPPLDFLFHNTGTNYYEDYSISKQTSHGLLVTAAILFLIGVYVIRRDIYQALHSKLKIL